MIDFVRKEIWKIFSTSIRKILHSSSKLTELEEFLEKIKGNEIRSRAILSAKVFVLFGISYHLLMSAFNTDLKGDVYIYLIWGGGLVILTSLLFVLEYENILRPLIKQMEETTIADRMSWPFTDFVRLGSLTNQSDYGGHTESGDDETQNGRPKPYQADEVASDLRRERAFALARMTLPWLIFRLSLPTIIVSINLGFSKMDHRSVVQAMGMELRRRYHRNFVAWNAPIANVHRFVQILALLFLVKALGSAWFEPIRPVGVDRTPPTSDSANHDKLDIDDSQPNDDGAVASLVPIDPEYYASLIDDSNRPRCTKLGALGLESEATRVLCGVPGGEFVVALLNFDILKLTAIVGPEAPNVLKWVLHRSSDLDEQIRMSEQRRICDNGATWCDLYGWGQPSDDNREDYSFRGYHLFLLIAVIALWRWISDFIPIVPYRRNLRRLDDLLDSLSSSRTEVRDRPMWGPARWVHSLFTDRKNHQISSEPLDPRTIEQAFMALLNDMQSSQINLPFGEGVPLTAAGPEITFVFDELDKLSGMPNVETSTEVAYDQDATVLAAERERVRMLYALLSDLKRIITSSPARFLFIGGRLLHEKWLADKTTRNPLLSSIFDGEIYIPALMNDHPLGYPHRWHSRTRQLLYLMHQRANEADQVHRQYNWSGILNLPIQQPESVRFLNEDLRNVERCSPPRRCVSPSSGRATRHRRRSSRPYP